MGPIIFEGAEDWRTLRTVGTGSEFVVDPKGWLTGPNVAAIYKGITELDDLRSWSLDKSFTNSLPSLGVDEQVYAQLSIRPCLFL